MRVRVRPVLTAGVLAGVFLAAGCHYFAAQSGDPDAVGTLLPEKSVHVKKGAAVTPEQDALIRVMAADKEHYKAGLPGLKMTAQPAAVTKAIGAYVEALGRVDTAGCPTEFKAARGRHVASWELLEDALSRLADAYDKEEFMDALAGLFRGNEPRGQPLGGDVIQAVKRVNTTHAEAFRLAEGYGLEVAAD